ncbi:hypothetical protein C9E85_16120 [Plesiomonas shigelloides]|uniref:hypothetical protein n=1 Tax=Plesiomonas shigelloides TaxID=703 RepID=UPI000D5808F1|nr:hypothetical protein [Plesiomonas shigelloides]PVU64837.1 hypothetical protein C9E85_16120 [Plesiomonas shigelloides]
MNQHKEYLVKIFEVGSTKFGICCFIIALISPSLGKFGVYAAYATYLAALACFYFATFKLWSSVQIKTPEELTVQIQEASGRFSSGNGHSFKEASLKTELCITNNQSYPASLSDMVFTLEEDNTYNTKLSPQIKAFNKVESSSIQNSVVLKPHSLLLVTLIGELEGNFTNAEEQAMFLRDNKYLRGTLRCKATTGTTTNMLVKPVEFDLTEIRTRFEEQWRNYNFREALNILST